MWLGVAGCGWVWLGVFIYLHCLAIKNGRWERKKGWVGEEKGLGGRGKRVGWEILTPSPTSLLRTRRGFHNVFDSSLKLGKN